MKKFRILALALTLVLCFGLIAGCVEDLPDVNAENGVIIESDDPASETIKVGLLGPDTGDVAQYGISVKNGVRLYIKELNAAGGINGKQVELINYDEEGDPQKAMTGYNALVDAGVTAIIGDVTTGPTNAVVPLAAEDNMPMITASATAASVTYDAETDTVYENMFRSCFIDPFSGEKMADFAYNELGVATAAVLNNVGDDYSAGCTEAFVAKAAELGLEIVALESYADGKVVDFQAQLTNIAAKNPDVLFIPYYYQTIALVAQQAKEVGLTATLLGVDGWASVLDAVADASVLEGAYYCSGFSAADTSESTQAFLAAYQAEYGADPGMFEAQGYDAAMILCAALAQAEDADLEAGSEDYKQAVIDAMKATDMECVTGHVTYNEYNNPEKSAVIIKISGGAEEFWGKF